jgi:uncharacterized protein (TIGR03437 family)
MLFAATALAQNAPDWRHIGGFSFEARLASPAGGPADRVWFSGDGSRLFVRTAAGRIYQTADFENWAAASGPEPPEPRASQAVDRTPTAQAKLVTFGAGTYALGDHVYRSEDSGKSWANLTAHGSASIIGGRQRSLSVSPRDADHVVVANDAGVWQSRDGGQSWSGLNDGLPNFPPARLAGTKPVQVLVGGAGALELLPGTQVWQPAAEPALGAEEALRRRYAAALATDLTAIARSGEFVYAGTNDGRLLTSLDGGRTWPLEAPTGGRPVVRIFADARQGRVALAATAAALLRTTNAGAFWDDLTGNLPKPIYGVTADRASGMVYAATARGVFSAQVDLENAAVPSASWARLAGLPDAAARDVLLDGNGYQLYVALEGFGVYAAAMPQRSRSLRVVNAADLSSRAAAPGSLLSVLGGRVNSAQAGSLRFPVLAATDDESQLQVPFEATGPELALAIEAASGRATLPLAVQPASPAIFVGPDSAPMLLDADTGLMLDAANTARSNARIQILATGLGRVRPNWPTGLAAPLNDPPAVSGKVEAFVDRVPVTVTRSTLAPGYIGFYLIEVQLPAIVNAGPAELYVSVDGQESNRVQLYLEP